MAEKKKSNILVFVIGTVVALIVCMAAVLCVAFSLVTEGTYEIDTIDNKTEEAPSTSSEVLEYLEQVVNQDIDNSLVSINCETSVSIDEMNYSYANGKDGTDVMEYIKGDIVSLLNEVYPENSKGEFGKEPEIIPNIILNQSDISNAECTIGQVDGDGNVKNEDYYFTSMIITDGNAYADSNSNTAKTFGINETDNIKSEIACKFSEIYKPESITTDAGDFSINMKTLIENDHISYITMERICKVKVNGSWIGKMESFGENEITFNVKVTQKFTYRYAGISIDSDEITVDPGSKDTSVPVTAVMNDDEEYSVTFSSSDESRVIVDEMGYITGLKESKEPVEIKVTLEYLGNTFSDTCNVYVINPVEKIIISQNKSELMIGDTLNLSATVKPKNATNKNVLWFVEGDENVISIDKNGKVVALAEGTVKAVAVSENGLFRDSCEIMVKGGESNG